MQSDAESRVPTPPSPNLWRLPKIVKLKIERVRYPQPRRHVVGGGIVERQEGVEIFVQTDEEIPVRALSPALYIGQAEVTENERVGEGQYRFFVLDEDKLRDGAMIALGWAGVPGRQAKTRFRYRAPRAKPDR